MEKPRHKINGTIPNLKYQKITINKLFLTFNVVFRFLFFFTYPQYKAALFQYGLFSAISLKFCTKSKNKQQQGASITTTVNPASIKQMLPNIQLTLKIEVIILNNPRIIATETDLNKIFH